MRSKSKPTKVTNSEPKTAFPLCQNNVKQLINEINSNDEPSIWVDQLHDLPISVLCSILEEMSLHPPTRTLHNLLQEPLLYSRLFVYKGERLLAFRQCLYNVDRMGLDPVLPTLAVKWCHLMNYDGRKPIIIVPTDITAALKMVSFLQEDNLWDTCASMLRFTLKMIDFLKDKQAAFKLRVKALQKLLHVESCTFEYIAASITCTVLLYMVEDITDKHVLFDTYMEVADYYFVIGNPIQGDSYRWKACKNAVESTQFMNIFSTMRIDNISMSESNENRGLFYRHVFNLTRPTFNFDYQLFDDSA